MSRPKYGRGLALWLLSVTLDYSSCLPCMRRVAYQARRDRFSPSLDSLGSAGIPVLIACNFRWVWRSLLPSLYLMLRVVKGENRDHLLDRYTLDHHGTRRTIRGFYRRSGMRVHRLMFRRS